ncbi:MAG: DNA mismatch repair endonuclease MutL [Oscillospiraceae bacterium]|nr:DNA mismatch repair endonuclease MutL [Oscillospiraceae bacterium]
MPTIKVLEKSVAELIAAGEIVERPASVVKELVENSIDAGATDISVEIKGGGIRLIRVMDNGCGISQNDVPKAFLRHATSKVRTEKDLDGILTLGFRGEALASVAAMSKVELATKTAGETEGTSYTIEGGEASGIVPAGRPNGTTITVRDIFYNTPARMKFLKKDVAEGNSVAQVVDKCALSHPEISFRFIRDGALKLKTSGGGDLLAVIYEIYGRDFSEELIPVDYTYENFARVTGYVSKPSGVKPSRSYQTFFINNRFVKTRTGMAALEEAYKNKIMAGKFPACVLSIELDAAAVDVNVHPAKTEVRFVNEKPVFSCVYYAVKSALGALESPFRAMAEDTKQARFTAREFREQFLSEAKKPEPSVFAYKNRMESDFSRPVKMNAASLDISVNEESPAYDKNHGAIFDKIAANKENTATNIKVEPALLEESLLEPSANLLVIGEVFGTYILIEGDDGLLLVDKHAAHERILYEKLKENRGHGGRQVLLTPQTVVLSRDEYTAVSENYMALEEIGFLAEDFGENTVVVREIPIELDKDDVSYLLREIADKLKNNAKDLNPNTLDRLYYSIACRSALKAGDKNSGEELLELIRQMTKDPPVTHCPHGRPVFVRIGRREIEKRFGRLGL